MKTQIRNATISREQGTEKEKETPKVRHGIGSTFACAREESQK
jgi:hypothetical protein